MAQKPGKPAMMEPLSYDTACGVRVTRTASVVHYEDAAGPVLEALDSRLGALLTSSFEYPGRYTRWDIGFVNPPLEMSARGLQFTLKAHNERGAILLDALAPSLRHLDTLSHLERTSDSEIHGEVRESSEWFPEELRSRQPTVFSVLRSIIGGLGGPSEHYLGFYGALGYELAFQFEAVKRRQRRDADQRDLVLFLPDEILIVDHRKEAATTFHYDFEFDGRSTLGMKRHGPVREYGGPGEVHVSCDHREGEYADTVRTAIEAFRRGDLFEVVPGQTFFEPCAASPAEVFRRLKQRNPAPYGALINLGEEEYLVAASPEMYVRVEGKRIETCPISGTIARGKTAIEDAAQIQALLNSTKDESELTMCTDVDRNDKSRVCVAGSVRVIGRRQLELYSRLIHTVDHVEGTLREEFDALDGFLAHTWAVTVTGAPKQHAIQFIEDHERSPRRWYGGAMGFIGFDGAMNTGLTLRTVRIKEGVAQVRAGATLLFESDPEAEEAETRLKASALLDAIKHGDDEDVEVNAGNDTHKPGTGKKILMVDHEDSFVHTLAGYFRETGAEVITYRTGFPLERIGDEQPDLVLLSPGPGRPEDFELHSTIEAAIAYERPLFGVCLGLQGLYEHFGGSLSLLEQPMHGKWSSVEVMGGDIFTGLPRNFIAGRYHSLVADPDSLPKELIITASTPDGAVMGIEHRSLPVAAVQFHPESILSLQGEVGKALVANVVAKLAL